MLPLTSNLTATADLNPTNMWSSRPSKPAYRFSNALLTEYPHFPFTLNVIRAPLSESEIESFLGPVYRRCGIQPPYWHPQMHISGSYAAKHSVRSQVGDDVLRPRLLTRCAYACGKETLTSLPRVEVKLEVPLIPRGLCTGREVKAEGRFSNFTLNPPPIYTILEDEARDPTTNTPFGLHRTTSC